MVRTRKVGHNQQAKHRPVNNIQTHGIQSLRLHPGPYALHYPVMWTYVRLLRPSDWVKNVFVFAALIFGGQITNLRAVELSLVAFAAFCLAASAGYVLNDMLDRDRDRLHPTKKYRPIASGEINLPTAAIMSIALLVASAVVSIAFLPQKFQLALSAYLVLTIFYSLFLKHRMILDVLIIAVLFVLRAVAGAYAIEIMVSNWLLVCTFMLCLFLGFGKRRCEIAMITTPHAIRGHRRTLVRYTPNLLTNMLSTTGGIAIITFLLYTLDTTTPSPFGDHKQRLVYTLPLVVYGVFRYAMLIELGKATGPTDLIVRDPPFLVTILLWCLTTAALLYVNT